MSETEPPAPFSGFEAPASRVARNALGPAVGSTLPPIPPKRIPPEVSCSVCGATGTSFREIWLLQSEQTFVARGQSHAIDPRWILCAACTNLVDLHDADALAMRLVQKHPELAKLLEDAATKVSKAIIRSWIHVEVDSG